MSKIAIFGANGTIGSRVLDEALRRGHQVTAVVRDPAKITKTDPNLAVTTGDILDPASVAAAAQGQDVLVSAVGGGDGPGHIATIKPAAESLVAGLRTLGEAAPRLISVGGAGSLRTPDGKQVWDAEGLPEFLLQIMHAHGDALDFYRTVTDVRWTNLSPAGLIEPGERTGTYRTALDDLVTDADGTSRISAEDYAVALLDEVEKPQHIGERFTVGY
ncbi:MULTISPECIES: NAD(P)-dependent oxidoreductase [Streptomyces]|uniref:NAD(P)H-binding protein n=2 Tax=Streptomyces rimosus subsp. rimosus TaxID=132474 RepID=L8EN67_STRR1|nr:MULTISPECIES: NAD(P)H-binding protein [Streptomyces]KOG72087.1 3-beta hydroxysteroid dehydrogenase [Kitasatospora aureofaciens]MYT44227.1 NAD(P)H-binding protein [Streptomyces sp. SID5471]KEF03907.1 3-beta hydroxysteroid dehydrogenase [Streptomyces rimosus]KEF17495.1 3-beta hydroxysteroid dehydrogenase [Streptomyces rimosus]KOT36071.1 3-beta hydroxysteroid dehydrogenase [Streptomyces sp. NRRL WC-3701]